MWFFNCKDYLQSYKYRSVAKVAVQSLIKTVVRIRTQQQWCRTEHNMRKARTIASYLPHKGSHDRCTAARCGGGGAVARATAQSRGINTARSTGANYGQD